MLDVSRLFRRASCRRLLRSPFSPQSSHMSPSEYYWAVKVDLVKVLVCPASSLITTPSPCPYMRCSCGPRRVVLLGGVDAHSQFPGMHPPALCRPRSCSSVSQHCAVIPPPMLLSLVPPRTLSARPPLVESRRVPRGTALSRSAAAPTVERQWPHPPASTPSSKRETWKEASHA